MYGGGLILAGKGVGYCLVCCRFRVLVDLVLRFETYVKAKDLDLCHIILNGDFPPVAKNKVTQILEVVPFEEQSDDLKKKFDKNNKAKMFLYNALPKREYEIIFMCKTAKDIWQSLLIIHQGNSQVRDTKIDLLVKQYEQFTILEEESIDSGFTRFNTIITSLKALDEGFSSKNYVRKFLRALHPKWRAKVTAIKESKDLSSLALDELIGNLKAHEVVMKKDSEIYRGKKERVKSIALKAKKEASDDGTLSSGSDDEEYAMTVRKFKKFFKRKGKFVRQPREEKKSFQQKDEKKGNSDRKYFRCGDPNHLIGTYPKPSLNKDQKALIGGSWSNSKNDAEDKTNDETCLMAQSSNEVTLNSSYYSDNTSSLDNDSMQIEYDSLCEISLKIINKNKILKTKRDLLEKEILELNEKIKKLERSKEIEIAMIDNTLFIIVQIYVNDIIFGSTSQNLCDDLAKIMHDEFEMSIMGELNFFLGLQIKQMKDEIFFNQSKYIKEMLKKFRLEDSKPTKTPMPDIMFSACLCARFQENHKTTHLEAVKRIFRPNGEALRKCILSGPYKPTTVLVHAVEATDDSSAVPEHTTVETPTNMSPEDKAHFLAEKEAIHLILTGIGDDIYSTVDACQTTQEIWEAIERLQQGQRLISSTTSAGMVKRDKDMQKNLAHIAKYFKKTYKPTNNNLRTSLNSKNKNVDTPPRYKNDDHFGQFGTQRTVNVAAARENVGNTDEEVHEQELEAHYSYMAKIQKVPTADSGTNSEPVEQDDIQNEQNDVEVSNTCLVETDDSNVTLDSPDMCEDDIQNEQNDVEGNDERVALANLIANLKLDVDENKKTQNQLKKANTTLAQQLKECKAILAETSKSLGESISV
nr:zf-CCHC domain-containing protein/UBN2 domain-containing protein [Tanacetum cinerariifolium]